MKSVAQFPRLTRRDCERILDCHGQLNRVKDALDRGSWAGGRMAAHCILSSLILLSDLYNRAELAFLRGEVPPPEPSFEQGQLEPPGPQPVDDAGTTPVNSSEEG